MFLLCKSISSVINENVCFESSLGHLFVMIDDKKILLIVCFHIFDSYILHWTYTSNVSEKMYSLRMSLRGLIMRGYFENLCWRTTNDCVQSDVLLWESTLRVYFEGFLWKCFVCDFCFVRVRLYGLLWEFTLRVYLDNPSWVSMKRNSFSNVRRRKFTLRVCFDNMSNDFYPFSILFEKI